MSAGSIDAESLCDEIAAAFRDVPHPDRYACEDVYDGDYEAERLEYLADKTWIEIASDLKYLALHSSSEFTFMTQERFFYFPPVYLLGMVKRRAWFVDRLAGSILDILNPPDHSVTTTELNRHLSARLASIRKKAGAHWLQLELERDKEHRPELYDDEALTHWQIATRKWPRL